MVKMLRNLTNTLKFFSERLHPIATFVLYLPRLLLSKARESGQKHFIFIRRLLTRFVLVHRNLVNFNVIQNIAALDDLVMCKLVHFRCIEYIHTRAMVLLVRITGHARASMSGTSYSAVPLFLCP